MAKKSEEQTENNVPVVEEKRKLVKKEYTLGDYKKENKLKSSTKSKPDRWIPASKAFSEITNLPGAVCMSHTTTVYGYRDTGKSTLMLETAINAQKMGILPIFIITEQKHRWSHAITMGFEIEEVVDQDGVVDYEGFFLYFDRSSFTTIEEMAELINKLITDQEKGLIPHDILFLIDSIGKVNCKMGIDNGKFQREWIASAISAEFGGGIIPRIGLSNKVDCKYTNSLFVIAQPWTEKADPKKWGSTNKMKPKGGACFDQDSSILIKFGDDTGSGTTKMKIKKDKKEIIWATRTKLEVVKNHVTSISCKGKLIATPHHFILENEEKKYLKDNENYLLSQVGASSIEEIEFVEEFDDSSDEG